MPEMTIDEYQARAIPRLARIDELDKLCEWDKFDFESSDPDRIRRVRATRERLMREQAADEVAAGL